MRFWTFLVVFLTTSLGSDRALAFPGKPFHVHAMALESLFFTPPSKFDIKKWGKEADLNSPQLEFLFRIARSADARPRRFNDLKGARILLIDTRSQAEIYITQNKTAVYNNRELPIKPAAIDQIVDQIKRAPWSRRR